MSKHTPGPWKYSPYHKGVLGGPRSIDGCRIAVCDMPTNGKHTHPAVYANAALIAAAPDLLAALESCLVCIAGNGEFWYEEEQARAAVAKATDTGQVEA